MAKDNPSNFKITSPKIAIVFDDLIQYGGAERLLLAVHEIWPKAPIYTSIASQEWRERCQDQKINLKISFMQKLPFKKALNRLYSVLGLHMLAFETFDFTDYDLVLSISSRYAHGVVTKPNTKHICYMNSPSRQFWETSKYFSKEPLLTRILKFTISPFLTHARSWDYISAQRVDKFIANSPVPQKRIKKYYQRESEIIYPPVEIPEKRLKDLVQEEKDYFLVLTRLLSWKRVDIAIKACQKLNQKLIIVGEGPAKSNLQKIAKEKSTNNTNKIKFTGYVSEKEKWKLLANAKALIMTQKEDFGITALESMAVGRPVIAYDIGGSQITIKPGETGEFFEEQTLESLAKALKTFEPDKYNLEACLSQSQNFSKSKFQAHLKKAVNKVYLKML